MKIQVVGTYLSPAMVKRMNPAIKKVETKEKGDKSKWKQKQS